MATSLTEQRVILNLIEKAMNKPVTDRDAENTLDQFGASLA